MTALFDPAGNETVAQMRTDADGTVVADLQPPNGQWQLGAYRWVVALGDGTSYSATFAAGDGAPHLFANPDQPSPTSAFNFVGIGFPAGAQVDLVLYLTGAGGQRTLPVKTDAAGTFSIFVWPQQFGFPFFSAGDYKIEAPGAGLTTDFMVREHPVSAGLTVDGPALSNGLENLHLTNYATARYVWTVYADMNGSVMGEFLLGPTDKHGNWDFTVHFSQMAPGEYLLATPYDWGDASFTVLAPPPTSTPTNTPTATPTKTPKPTSRHKTVSCKKAKKQSKSKKKCAKKARSLLG
jgi:hypothetical protein